MGCSRAQCGKPPKPSVTPGRNGAHQAGLRAAFADRQWPQDRCWTAGWTEHDRCLLCIEEAASHSHPGASHLPTASTSLSVDIVVLPHSEHERANDDPPEVSQADILSAPVGVFIPRVRFCPHHKEERACSNVHALNEARASGEPVPDVLLAAISSGVYPQPKLNLAPRNRRPPCAGILPMAPPEP